MALGPPVYLAATGVVALASFLLRRNQTTSPTKLVILLSGKRKSGKDYLADKLVEAIKQQAAGGGMCEIGRLSGPLKKAFAEENDLNYQELLTDGPYKEQYRAQMIAWGEARRQADPGYFARLVLASTTAPILIISDARRETDLQHFIQKQQPWQCLTIRVEVSLESRMERGWKYTPRVDDAESECGLDGRAWDVVVLNDGVAAGSKCVGAVEVAKPDAGHYSHTMPRSGGVDEQIAAIAHMALSRL